MANRNEILNRIGEYKNAGQDLIRREYLSNLHEYTGNDTIIYASAFPCHIPLCHVRKKEFFLPWDRKAL